ncbi:SpoIIE family protein phosphatase [Streptomyces sp. NPDC092296]|uniref:ATP-binding SpoIIE family protein phosphatase n=1 Tax=Streptomyces sp. NPDC092296 TaxID=3366012 RepID=UPI0038212972
MKDGQSRLPRQRNAPPVGGGPDPQARTPAPPDHETIAPHLPAAPDPGPAEAQTSHAARLELALTATGTGSFDWDLAADRLAWDDRTRQLFALPAGQYGARPAVLRDRVLADDLPRLDAAVRAAVAACGPYRVHFRVTGTGGAERRVSAHGRALAGPDGRAARVVGIVRDVTAEQDLASWLQRIMLPRRMPRIPGVAVAARYTTGTHGLELGGDWYDVIPLPGAHVGLVIGDVQGHNVHAAAVMGQLRAALRAYAAEGHDPAAVASRASRFLADLDTGLFATCTYLDLDTLAGSAEIVRAGQLGPLIRGPHGDCAWPAVEGGLPLGIEPEHGYPVTRLDLEPGSALLLCTDGAVGSRTLDMDSGARGLREYLAASPVDDLEALAGAMADLAREQHGGPDDLALLLARWDAPADHVLRRRLRRAVDPADLVAVSRVRRQLRAALLRWGVPELADTAELLASELVTNALVHTDHGAVLAATLVTPAPDAAGPGVPDAVLPDAVLPDAVLPDFPAPLRTAPRTPARGTRLRVEVHDRASQRPQPRTPGEQASSGRGLLLVQALADDWGVQPRGEGKVTWFELVCP